MIDFLQKYLVPAECMQFTSVFVTAKFEYGICTMAGILIGIAIGSHYK